MNKAELEEQVASYTHRTDLSMQIGGFIDLATARIGRDLRSDWNFKTIEAAINSVPYEMPADFREVRLISSPQGAGTLQLRSAPAHEFSKVSGSGLPAWYRLTGRLLHIAPFQARNYTIEYWTTPDALELSTDTNDVLEQYPYLYLYGALVEAGIYLQDPDMELRYRDKYLEDLGIVNAESAQRRTGDAPAMRAI